MTKKKGRDTEKTQNRRGQRDINAIESRNTEYCWVVSSVSMYQILSTAQYSCHRISKYWALSRTDTCKYREWAIQAVWRGPRQYANHRNTKRLEVSTVRQPSTTIYRLVHLVYNAEKCYPGRTLDILANVCSRKRLNVVRWDPFRRLKDVSILTLPRWHNYWDGNKRKVNRITTTWMRHEI